MSRVTYRCGRTTISEDTTDPRVLLTDRQGGYLALGSPNRSNYDGWYAIGPDGHRWKLLADISPPGILREILVESDTITRRFDGATQILRVSDRGVWMRGKGSFLLTLDCKRQHDESDQGRLYQASLDQQGPVQERSRSSALARVRTISIEYRKHVDHRIQPDTVAYRTWLCVATTFDVSLRDTWRAVTYAYDDRRGSRSTPWVRDTAFLTGDGDVAIAFGADAREARRKATDLLLRPPKNEECSLPEILARAPLPARVAWRSLNALRSPTGILAGLPWFFQEWSRDELTSAGALLAAGDAAGVAAIVDKWYGAVRQDGTLPAIYPAQGVKSADAPGWLGKRTLDLLASAHPISKETLARWRDAADRLIGGLDIRDGLVRSERNETWKDTATDDDGRAGYRVEVQALALALLAAHVALCERTDVPIPERTVRLREAITRTVRERLVRGDLLPDGLLSDGTPDPVVRPNVFIAWYVWPDLVAITQWRKTFWLAIDRLWLPWGGLATIPASDPRFRGRDTGEDVAAYHRGDSWYFINAIAAMALRAVDPTGGAPAARRLLGAIERDLLTQGYLGHVSEISSANEQEPMGCHAQAWSAACYVEAMIAIQALAGPGGSLS